MVSLCSHMTDGASSLQRRAFGNRRKGASEGVVVVGFCQRARVAFESGCATLCTGDIRHKQRLAKV